MCLVSYVPLNNGFALSSNRDESPERAVNHLNRIFHKDRNLVYPQDIQGGSWIAASSRAEAFCVLNGAFQKHKRRLPYRMSRGKMLKSIFDYVNAVDFLEQFDFFGIEPFTLVMRFQQTLLEFRWDGEIKHISQLDPKREHIWSSCTLYSLPVQETRYDWFQAMFNTIDPTPENIANIHLTGGKGNLENGFVMNRNNIVQTVSFTQVIALENKIKMVHRDLITNQSEELELDLAETSEGLDVS